MTRLINSDGRDVTAETLELLKKVMGNGGGLEKAATVTTSAGLVAYNLEAPSKNLYPVLTPLRNRVPRKSGGTGTAVNWRQVSAIAGNALLPSMGWVPEGQRAARMVITTDDKSVNYKTMGLETDVTFEAQSAARGFEDVLSTSGIRLLQQTMILEEYGILGGNSSHDLGTPGTPTVTVTAIGGTINAGANTKVRVRVFALTMEGYLMASLTGGIKRVETITGMDAQTYDLNGGASIVSLAGSENIGGATNIVEATVAAVRGAVAYAWFIELGGAVEAKANSHLEAITTLNSVSLTALNGTYQALSTITDFATDRSKNSYAFDGLLYSAFASSLAYYSAQATGTAGTGTGLTSSGHGSITEIDTMLETMWSSYRLGPDELYVNAQELKNIVSKVLNNASAAPLVRFNLDVNQQNPTIVAGQVVGYYFNPFTVNGGQVVPIRIHPNLPPGTMFGWCQNLPAYYQSANVPQVAEMDVRREYYQIPWPLVTRANQSGVYVEEVLKVYAPFAVGVITNIGNA